MSPADLVERVSEAIRNAAYGEHACMADQRIAQASAAIRVVVEACAEEVDGWHISKGGYGNLAHTLRDLIPPAAMENKT